WLLNFRSSLPQVGRRCAWGGLLLGELWALVMPHVAVRPEEALYAPSQSVRFLVGEQRLKPNERWRVLDRGLPGLPSSSPLGPALPMLGEAGIEPILGYNSFDVRRYKEYLQLIMDRDEPVRPRAEPF